LLAIPDRKKGREEGRNDLWFLGLRVLRANGMVPQGQSTLKEECQRFR
jgi:hypothetical protein